MIYIYIYVNNSANSVCVYMDAVVLIYDLRDQIIFPFILCGARVGLLFYLYCVVLGLDCCTTIIIKTVYYYYYYYYYCGLKNITLYENKLK